MAKLYDNAKPGGSSEIEKLLTQHQAAHPMYRVVCSKGHRGRFPAKFFKEKSQHGDVCLVAKPDAAGRAGLHLHFHKKGIHMAAHQPGDAGVKGYLFRGRNGHTDPKSATILQELLKDEAKIVKHFGVKSLQPHTEAAATLELWLAILRCLLQHIKAPPKLGERRKSQSPLRPRLNFKGGSAKTRPTCCPQTQAQADYQAHLQAGESKPVGGKFPVYRDRPGATIDKPPPWTCSKCHGKNECWKKLCGHCNIAKEGTISDADHAKENQCWATCDAKGRVRTASCDSDEGSEIPDDCSIITSCTNPQAGRCFAPTPPPPPPSKSKPQYRRLDPHLQGWLGYHQPKIPLQRKIQFPCRFFNRGHCRNGTSCKFLHVSWDVWNQRKARGRGQSNRNKTAARRKNGGRKSTKASPK